MTLAFRLVPNAGVLALLANGRSYAVSGAATIDVPYNDGFAIGPDQARRLMITGATTDRPAIVPAQMNWPPQTMYDTTLGKPIFLVPGSNPAQWTDITGSLV